METSIIEAAFEISVSHLSKEKKIDKICDYIMSVNENLTQEKSSSHINHAMIAYFESELKGAKQMLHKYTA
jgi:hypothetical protein